MKKYYDIFFFIENSLSLLKSIIFLKFVLDYLSIIRK